MRIALKSLEAKEYILKTRYGASRNPHATYYAVRRETLMVQPVVDKHRKSFTGILSSQWQEVILRGHAQTVAERERRLEQWEQLGNESKHEGLSRILLDPELLFRKWVAEDAERLHAWMQLPNAESCCQDQDLKQTHRRLQQNRHRRASCFVDRSGHRGTA